MPAQGRDLKAVILFVLIKFVALASLPIKAYHLSPFPERLHLFHCT
jgi:hypothetical protein